MEVTNTISAKMRRAAIAIIMLVACCHVCYASEFDNILARNKAADAKIDSMLYIAKHYQNCSNSQDTALMFINGAMRLANETFGPCSNRFLYIVSDFLLPYHSNNRETCLEMYDIFINLPEISTKWYCCWRLGQVLADLEEYDKANKLFAYVCDNMYDKSVLLDILLRISIMKCT